MAYVWYFLQIVLYTMGAVVVCGLAVHLCEYLVLRLMGGAGSVAVKVTSLIGTPIHELGHAVMCLLFGHKITEMVLWQPNDRDGTMGYVSHTYNPKNPYHQLGNLFIGIGPVFSGLGVMLLALLLCFPETLDMYLSSAGDMVASGDHVFAIFFEGMKMIPHMIEEFSASNVPVWAKLIGLLVMLSVALHVNLSPADIKGALRALPIYLILVLLVTVVTSLIGESVMEAVTGGLAVFNAFMTMLFVIVMVFAVIHIALALVVWLFRSLLFRR